jgi:serine/threonine protein kinase
MSNHSAASNWSKATGSFHRSTTSLGSQASGLLFRAFESAETSFKRSSTLANIKEKGKTENWLLDVANVKVERECVLGEGGFGMVLEGELYGARVAVKMPRLDSNRKQGDISLSNELRVLRHVIHPNVVMFYGSCIDSSSGDIILVLELLRGPQLDALALGSELPCPMLRHRLLLDICRALRYLHDQKPRIVHGDLKGSNILVEFWFRGPRAKLLDFGLSRLLTKHAPPLGGTVTWMAPEVICDRQSLPSDKADIFSFGRLVFLLVSGKRPLQHMTMQEIVDASLSGMVPSLSWPDQADAPLCGDWQPLAEQCLSFNAQERPCIEELCEDARIFKFRADPMQPQPVFKMPEAGEASAPCGKSCEWEDGWQPRLFLHG